MITILGCGPTGLLAAHACALAGREFRILSIKTKAVVPGAMYLHEAIHGITPVAPQMAIKVVRQGSREEYARKVYGDPNHPVSWDYYRDDHYISAWSMYDAYEALWLRYQHQISDCVITGADLLWCDDPIISTIPKQSICVSSYHTFERVKYWVLPDAAPECPDDTIIYNGEPHVHWHRTSRIGGWEFTESRTPMPHAERGWKPTRTDCDCHPTVMCVGRFGAWDKSILAHQAFNEVRARLELPDAL